MKILIVGAGGREHAIAWKLSQYKDVEKIFIAPGNAGAELLEITENVELKGIKEYIDFAKKNGIDFTKEKRRMNQNLKKRIVIMHESIQYVTRVLDAEHKINKCMEYRGIIR